MSNEVDKRIIEMEFKNEEFEKNASKTLGTLDALKAKLNNNFSTKAAERLNESIKAVDVSPIAKGIDMVQYQFNALQIAGKRVIENIVDSAMRGITDVKNKLMGVVNQIKVGGANRAQNIEQAKFMLEGLGIQWAQIEADINYGVQDTAYGLDAAAKVASQLVASNVSLGEEMQHALLGISGVAAMTNSTYEDIGRIFTTVAGNGRLMGDQLLQLSGRGLNVASELSKALNKTEAEIREMTSKGQIDFRTFSEAMYNAFGKHAKEANKTFTGVLSNTRAALSRLGADIQAQKFEVLRQLLSKVIPKLKELKTALKPVEESIKTAMAAFGKLAEYLVDRINVTAIIEAVTPKITHFMNLVTEFANTAREYIQKLDESKPSKFIQNVKEAAEVVKKITDATKEEIDMAKRIWNVGDIGNGEERIKNLKALGFEYSRVQGIVDAFIDSNYDWDAAVKQTTTDLNDGEKAVNGFIGPLNENKKPTTIYLIVDALFNLSKIIKNVVGSAINIASVVKDTFKEVFTPRGIAGQVNTFAGILGDISDKLYVTKGDVEQFKPLITFIFSAMKALAKVLLTLGKWAFVAANKVAQIFNTIRNSKIVNTILTTIGKCIQVIIEKMKIVFGYLRDSGILNKFINILKYIALWLGDKLVNAFIFLANHAGDVFIALASGFGWVIEQVEKLITKIDNAGGFMQVLKDFFSNGVEVGKSWIERIGDKLNDLFGGEGEDNQSIFKKAFDRASAFGKGLIEGLNSITFEDLKDAGGIVAKIATVLSLLQFLGSLSTLNNNVGGFFKRLGKFFDSLTSISRAYANKTTASAIEALGRTLLMVVVSITALAWTIATVPGGKDTVDKAIEMVTVFVTLIGLYEIIVSAIKRRWSPTSANKLTLLINARKIAIVTILGSIALFTSSIISLIKNITKGLNSDDPEQYSESIMIAVGVIAIVLGMLISSVYAMMKMANDMNGLVANDSLEKITKLINVITKTIIRLSLTIILLTAAYSLIGTEHKTEIAYAIFTLIGILAIIAGAAIVIIGVSRSLSEGDARYIETLTKIITVLTNSIVKLMGMFILITITMEFASGPAIALAFGTFALIVAALGVLYLAIAKLNIGEGDAFSNKMKALNTITKSIVAIMVGFAALALALGQMNQMGVDPSDFMVTVAIIGGVVTLITLVGGLVGSIPGITVGLTAFGTAMTGLGIAMAGIGGGVLMLVAAMVILDKFLTKIDEFREKILDKKDVMVACIGDLIGVIAQGLFVGLIQALNSIINNMEPLVEALLDTVISLFNTLGVALSNRASELADASYILVKGIVKVIVEVLAEAIGGIIAGVTEAVDEINDKVNDWLKKEEQKDIEEQQGKYKDNMADAYVQRLKSSAYTDAEKETFKRYLRENGYDEEGNRTINWDLNTSFVIRDNAKIEQDKSNEIYQRYGGKTEREYVPFDTSKISKKAADEAKTAEENSNSIADSMSKITENSLDINKYTDEFLGNIKDSGQDINEGNATLTNLLDQFNMDIVNQDSMNTASDVIANEAEESATNFEEYQKIVNDKSNVLATAIENMAKRIQKTLEDLSDSTLDIGVKVVDGFVSGMSNMAAVVKLQKASKVVGETVKETMEKVLDIHSPSRVMEKLGDYTIVGFANGITNSIGVATSATQEAGESAILSMRETIKRLSLEAAEGLNNSPRITPILDISNVTDGINSINGMFDTTHAVKLAGVTSTEASAATSRRLGAIYQNGSNFDDTNTVNAITSLQGEIATLKDNINGMQVVIDSRALVGQIATPMDKALGRKALAGRRGS